MRRILLLSALAIAATGSAASAATHVALTGFCNNYAFRIHHGTLAMKDTGCSSGFGGGFVGGIVGQGKTAIMGLQDPASPGDQFVFKFSYPLTNGGTWSLYLTSDGVTLALVTSGNYTLGVPGGAEKGTRSATSR